MATQLLGALLIAGLLGASTAQRSAADQSCQTVQDCTNKINQAKQQQNDTQAKIAALKAKIASLDVKEAGIVAIIHDLDGKITATKAAISALDALIEQIQIQLTAAQRDLVQAQAQLNADRRQLATAVVMVYELQNQNTSVANLISSGDFNAFWQSVIDGRRISALEERSANVVQQDQAAKQRIVDSIAADQQREQDARFQQLAALATLNNQSASEQDALAYYAQLQVQTKQAEQQAEAAAAALQTAITKLVQQRNQLGSGRLVWPDPGPISQGFGCTVYSFEPYDAGCPWPHRFHNGLDIAGPCYTQVVAADGGIAYPQPFMSYGYGNWILIDHGAGMVTLYGHLAQYAVRYGQFVTRGQLIGHEGTTGNSTGCHLHFSVFINDTAVNPLRYLPPRY